MLVMPTSKLTRVRSDGFSKISASCLPSSAWANELGGHHQSLAAHFADDPQLALQLFQLLAKIDADLAHAVEEAGPLDDLEELQGEAALQRSAAERGAVHPGREGLGYCVPSD